MPIEIKMPALSPTMETGNLAKWLVKEGQSIEPGDVIAEIETDKATMEVESADEGVVGKLMVAEGTENVPVGETIAILLEEGEDKSALKDVGKKEKIPSPQPSPAQEEVASEEALKETLSLDGRGKGEGDIKKTPSPQSSPTRGEEVPAALGGNRIKASPLAKRLAKEKGLNLAAIQGSGPGGRIVKADVETDREKPGAVTAPEAAPPVIGDAPYEEVKLSNVRKIIARRLLESKQTIPHYYLNIEANIGELLKVRRDINEKLEGVKVSVNDFIIKALALALIKVPNANVQWGGEFLRKFKRADVSVAVAIPDGLITPIIRGADAKRLRDISVEMKVLAAKARDGKLMPEDYQGGTFSLSNLGMFGIKDFAAVINPPQAGILAIGAGEKRPVLKDGHLENQTFMAMTGSFDHRAIDGATGAEFLRTIKELLEVPAVLLY